MDLGAFPFEAGRTPSTLTEMAANIACSAVSSIPNPAGFQPSIWGDVFAPTCLSEFKMEVESNHRMSELKEEVMRMLLAAANEPVKQLNLINHIQRLGVEYHLESEIENALEMIHNDTNDHDYDLFSISLKFRLLRQAGFYISPDVFERFKTDKDEFDEKLVGDVEGLLSLYEAAHLGFHGEDTMDEAISFTTSNLKLLVTDLKPPLAKQVLHALELPLHKRFPRLEARQYISMYEEDETRTNLLLEFSMLDFNLVQSLHIREMREVTRWWKELNILKQLPFTPRDRLVECYAVMMASFAEPKYSSGRIFMSKIAILVSILDDYYDVYRKMDELRLLTDAVSRWDDGEADNGLNEHLKAIFRIIHGVYNDLAEEVAQRQQQFSLPYYKQQMQHYVRHLMEESDLFDKGQVPTLEEFFRISSVTMSTPLLNISMIISGGEHVTIDSLDWAVNGPNILISCNWIWRLVDDIATCKLEQERGVFTSCVTCYMKDHGVSESEAFEKLREMIKYHWKIINKECMRPTPVPRQLLIYQVNTARMMESFYIQGDGYSNPSGYSLEMIGSLLIDPISM